MANEPDISIGDNGLELIGQGSHCAVADHQLNQCLVNESLKLPSKLNFSPVQQRTQFITFLISLIIYTALNFEL